MSKDSFLESPGCSANIQKCLPQMIVFSPTQRTIRLQILDLRSHGLIIQASTWECTWRVTIG